MEKWYIENLNNPNEGKYPAFEIDISSESQSNICTVWYSDLFSDEAKQNALLISKAPEMLEFLIELFNDKETHSGMFPSQQQKLEQLIKEATEL